MKAQLWCGEFLCVVPRPLVHEPICWGDIPYVIKLGELAVEAWVNQHERDNDPEVREAITHFRLRRLWYKPRSLDLSAIAFT
jgi:hypothetical protein